MADILTQAFITYMSHPEPRKDREFSPPPPPSCRSALVVGEHRVSRSVLLLAAVTAASEMGMKVMFFAQKQIQSLPVSLQKNVPGLSPDSLKVDIYSLLKTVVVTESFTT